MEGYQSLMANAPASPTSGDFDARELMKGGLPSVIYTNDIAGNETFQCKFCRVSFNNHFDISVHMRVHEGESTLSIVNEQQTTLERSLGDGKSHERATKGRPYRCLSCSRKFSYPKNLLNHLKKFHKSNDHEPVARVPRELIPPSVFKKRRKERLRAEGQRTDPDPGSARQISPDQSFVFDSTIANLGPLPNFPVPQATTLPGSQRQEIHFPTLSEGSATHRSTASATFTFRTVPSIPVPNSTINTECFPSNLTIESKNVPNPNNADLSTSPIDLSFSKSTSLVQNQTRAQTDAGRTYPVCYDKQLELEPGRSNMISQKRTFSSELSQYPGFAGNIERSIPSLQPLLSPRQKDFHSPPPPQLAPPSPPKLYQTLSIPMCPQGVEPTTPSARQREDKIPLEDKNSLQDPKVTSDSLSYTRNQLELESQFNIELDFAELQLRRKYSALGLVKERMDRRRTSRFPNPSLISSCGLVDDADALKSFVGSFRSPKSVTDSIGSYSETGSDRFGSNLSR